MKYFFLFSLIYISVTAFSQEKQHKIVWEINAKDTSVHSAIFRQINNVLSVAPDTKIEVVFHGNAITVLTHDSSLHVNKIQKEQQRGVIFAICNNSMKRLNVPASRLLPEVQIVPVAIMEIVKKQSEGYSYIKAGY